MGNAVRINVVQDFLTEECIKCGITFAVTRTFNHERKRDHNNFYCPNGHGQHYPGESDVEKANRLLTEEQARHQRSIARLNEEADARAKLERKLKRVDRGICPECNRTFVNLGRHMACKHATK